MAEQSERSIAVAPADAAAIEEELAEIPAQKRAAIRSWEWLVGHKEIGVIAAVVLVALIFRGLSAQFFTLDEFGAVVSFAAELGIVAIGVTFLIIAGEFDLSVGAVFALAPLLLADLYVNYHWNEWAAFVLVLVVAMIIGLANGVVTTWFKIPSFIVTLGMMLFLRGAILVISDQPIATFQQSSFANVFSGVIGGSGFFTSAFWFLGLTIIFIYLLESTRYGNWTFATGGKAQAARAMGVPVNRVKIINFVLAALLAGFAGCIDFARLGSATPSAGTGYELQAIVAAVIGGTSLFGGTGSILGAALGACLMGMINTGLVLVGAPPYYYQSYVGIILIAAVIINAKIGIMKLRAGLLGGG
jgi:simple sugar transport system permease protein